MSDTADQIAHELQMKREQDSADRGILRYLRSVEEADEGTTLPGAAVVKANVGPVAARIERELTAYANGKAAANAVKVLTLLKGVDPTSAAFLTLRCGIGAAFRQANLSQTAIALGGLIEEHLGFVEFHEREKGLAEWWENRLKEKGNTDHRRKIVRSVLRGHGDGAGWPESDRLAVGGWLLGFIYASGDVPGMVPGESPLLHVHVEEVRARTTYKLRPSQALIDTIDRGHEVYSMVRPFDLPMSVPPIDWTDPLSGGYLTRTYPLMIGAKATNVTELWSANLAEVYAALNAIQRTPWQVNKAVLSVLKVLSESPAGGPGLASREPAALPMRPPGIPTEPALKDLPEDQQALIKEWRFRTREVHAENAKRLSKVFALSQKLSVAEEFSGLDRFYFPHRIDSRGRIYPMPIALHPQADDVGKGLLRFADGKALGDDGFAWLHIHLANCAGVDKVTFAERLQWVEENHDMIVDVALSPLDTVAVWGEMDSPWQFLAAAFEYAGAWISGDPTTYVSHLPIGMDGSCSGLQHFSAALRDEVGGRAVNLTPTGKVEDLYTEVARRVNLRLDSSTCADDLLVWRGLVTRKIVKQPCMTYAYSATVAGMRDQIAKAAKALGLTVSYGDCAKLAPVVRECIEEVVLAAAGAMKWMQEVSSKAADLGKDVRWISASGLPVIQRVTKPAVKRPRVWFAGVRLRVQLAEDTNVIDKMGQRNAIAPNWVHSQDAAHLVSVVNTGVENGLTHFAMIHDSFGVHAADVTLLNGVIRETFVQQYSVNLMFELKAQLEAHLGEELPALPPFGSLDLDDVIHSEYFFA